MQMQFGIFGFGIGIPKTKFQIGTLSIAKIYLRRGVHDKNLKRLHVQDLISIGGKSGTFIWTAVRTKWFELDPAKDGWAHNANALIGRKIEMLISGIAGKWGTVDFTLKQFDKYNQSKVLVDQCCIDVEGIQFSDMKLRGVVSISKI